MNWTEGKLARHSRARQSKQSKQILLRQKEHFAKARAGLLPSTSKQTPPAMSLSPSAGSCQAEDLLFAATPHHSPAPGDVVAHRKRQRLTMSSSPRNAEPITRSVSGHQRAQRIKKTHGPSPLSAKRVDDSAVLEKRRRLLRENDWAGIRMQKPIPVRFEQSPPGGNRWARRGSAASRARHLGSGRDDHLRKVDRNGGHPYKKQDVRITVGSQEVRLGEGSSVHQSGHAATGSGARQTFRGAAMPSTFVTSSSNLTQPSQEIGIGGHPPTDRESHLSSLSESSESHHAKDDSGRQPPLKAPVPIRHLPGLPLSFESLAHGTRDSTVAQVGQPATPIPESQLGENEVWRNFVGPSQSNASREDSAWEARETSTYPHISPGVSTRYPQLVSNPVSQKPASPSAGSNISGYQRTPSYDPFQQDSRLDQAAASASGPGILLPSARRFSGGQGIVGPDSTGSGPDSISGVSEHLTGDSHSPRPCAGHVSSSEASDLLSGYANVDQGNISASTDSETDSIDHHVAGLREAALKLVSRPTATSRRIGSKPHVDGPTTSPQYPDPDSNPSSPEQREEAVDTLGGHDGSRDDATSGNAASERRLDLEMEDSAVGDGDLDLDPPSAAHEAAGGTSHERWLRKDSPGNHPPGRNSPREDSDDIWFKYVFSDTNTDDLHKEVLDEVGSHHARKVQAQADREDSERIPESELGYNVSVAATPGQPSVAATEFGANEELTSASGVSASHLAAVGSPLTITQTASTASGPSGEWMDQSVTDVTCSFPSKAVEAPQSVVESARPREGLRFAPPKLFVGKLSESVPSDRPVMAVKPVTMTRPKRGRPKKKARDGRADIKSIPVYHDDPIEDFDDLGARKRAQARDETSLFGALDME